ncbi:hypothetical protein FOI68_13480 [Brevibacillus sp. LEMMJ03]|uniref:hypothetical protein n=1 Tax=Brevibacillus sp. LEMMJ03 TaxID=2595056 RepID=UPI00117EEEAC|nr:hypothetical protein [Brevibacillus sp. LEMMJ03]TRY25359.1 hypothetical protein FOI68_13480 [Brevibacillus sp. LEMMJ03]
MKTATRQWGIIIGIVAQSCGHDRTAVHVLVTPPKGCPAPASRPELSIVVRKYFLLAIGQKMLYTKKKLPYSKNTIHHLNGKEAVPL